MTGVQTCALPIYAINLMDSIVNNITNVDLVTMDDGGCWFDIVVDGLDEAEEEKIRAFLEDNSLWDLEDLGYEQADCEWWIWGPIEVTNDNGYRNVIIADDDGNMINFVED